MNSVKSFALASCLLLFLACAAGCDSTESEWQNKGWARNHDVEASASFDRSVGVDQHTRLRLSGINGSVELTGSAGTESVAISGWQRVFSDSRSDAEKHLKYLEVHVEDLDDEVFIRTDQPKDSQGRSYVVDYVISVPGPFDVEIDNINGDIRMNETLGSVSVDLTNGKISCRSSRPPTDIVDLSTVNGSITLEIPKSTSARLTASVVHGDIETSNLVFSNEVRSSRSMSGTLGGGLAAIDLSTVNGNIDVKGF